MADLHDLNHVSEVHGRQKFHFKKSRKADGRRDAILKIEKSRHHMQNVSY